MKKDNRGFSLVELIIVIAIMAILVVVLAPQYLRYVERARNATDVQNATGIVTALQIYQADPQAGNPLDNSGADTNTATIHIGSEAANSGVTNGNADFVSDALAQAGMALSDISCRSTTPWSEYNIQVTLNTAGGIDIIYTSVPGAVGAGSDPFETAMNGN